MRFSHFFPFFLFSITFAGLSDGIDYNKLVKWEKRTLICQQNKCKLSIKDGPLKETNCEERIEKALSETPLIHDCEISCPGADRDSVISKTPSNNHKCIRYYSYDTLQNGDKWSIWRSGVCANQVNLEISICKKGTPIYQVPVPENNHSRSSLWISRKSGGEALKLK